MLKKVYCSICNNEFKTNSSVAKICSKECKRLANLKAMSEMKKRQNEELFKDKSLNIDYIECEICKMKMSELSTTHLKTHNLNKNQYIEKFPLAKFYCEKAYLEKSERVKGDKNPGYKHGGKFSPFSNKFIGSSKKEDVIEKLKESKRNNPQNDPTKLEYYFARGMNRPQAKQALSERQSTFSREKCIEKYGEIEGIKIWKDRQEKWLETLDAKSDEEKAEINSKKLWNGGFTSKAELEIYNILVKKIPQLKSQFPIQIENGRHIYYDMMYNNKIIEYNGDFWHANPEIYKDEYKILYRNKTVKTIRTIDKYRRKVAYDSGYSILTVWKKDYTENKEKVIEKCLNFLKQ